MKRKRDTGARRRDLAYLIGRRVAALRKDHEWGQAQLAAKAGLNVKYIGELENGRRDVRVTTLSRLAKALGIEPAGLFRFSEEDRTLAQVEEMLRGRDQAFRGHVLRVVNEILMIADSAN